MLGPGRIAGAATDCPGTLQIKAGGGGIALQQSDIGQRLQVLGNPGAAAEFFVQFEGGGEMRQRRSGRLPPQVDFPQQMMCVRRFPLIYLPGSG